MAHMDDGPRLTQLQRDVLRRVGIARKAGDVRFLLAGGGWSLEDITSALVVLSDLGLAVEDSAGFWIQTGEGAVELRRIDVWELVVEDTFELSGVGTVVKGELICGEIHAGDFFRIDGGDLGRVLSIEFALWRDSDPAIAFQADVPLVRGQMLTGGVPEAGVRDP
jgi:hypothetical protein